LAPFDWQSAVRPNLPKEDLVIYELHVRGFTTHPSSKVKCPGTYRGLIEKIPYLKKLGINAIELMPIFEFDECHHRDPSLMNYWGYNPVSFFAPKRSYASANPFDEFRTLVRELHKNGIEVILDVVYNHTGEGKLDEPTFCWRGLDNSTYYLIDRAGQYKDYSGCGNTINANHPVTLRLILDSLRFWATEMQVDGFRFDLASILTRGPNGHPMSHPSLLEAIQKDPLLSSVKLISESWDASGLYQLGAFPKWGPWSEWNGRYRDIIRRFIKGTNGKVGLFASALCGSDFLYKAPTSSINFVTCHDGYTLRDLVTYQRKHNEANGEYNQDGANQNDSWNCGIEGPSSDPTILSLRERQMRNFWLALLLSQGIPMILMGDEYGHTRKGNNNAYVHDNELNWFLWDKLEQQKPLFQFVRDLISFRKKYPFLHSARHLNDENILWHGHQPLHANWDYSSRFIAFQTKTNPSFYLAFNNSHQPASITLPSASWRLIVNTEDPWEKQHFLSPGPLLPSQLTLAPYSALAALST
jgi:isoamylase/glycogen operon protein